MDSLMSFGKENFQLIVLGVSMLGVLVGVVSVCLEIKKRKQKKQQKKDEIQEDEQKHSQS